MNSVTTVPKPTSPELQTIVGSRLHDPEVRTKYVTSEADYGTPAISELPGSQGA